MSTTVRPKSTNAQIITAAAALASALILGSAAVWFVKWNAAVAESFTDLSGPSAVTQWVCLPYTEFVLDQHRAGLTPDQITAALEVSEYSRTGQLGVTQPLADINEPRIDSTDACGLPHEIITASTR
ncbi:hypothetical protein BO226_24515 (plasmid) [Rhodococcus sp. 2G]|jgi:hypothetical protein|uniref:hypothetical protein n=1 Tax=Rhodococcus TaxID=1827 RepID=UPI0007DA12C0|nr:MULTISPECIES: hypothetical protein [Rhodococcus]APE12531.1 hypothetical protein BO226_24515 [Rhodococcus sp. 2G]